MGFLDDGLNVLTSGTTQPTKIDGGWIKIHPSKYRLLPNKTIEKIRNEKIKRIFKKNIKLD